jgi:hypothetical protein
MTHHDDIMIPTYLPTNQPTNLPTIPKEPRHKYGEYNHVLLTDTQYQTLKTEWGEQELSRMITMLDNGIESKGYKYKNFMLALRKWKENNYGKPYSKPLLDRSNGYTLPSAAYEDLP